jgi:paraquat-inducible protein A
MNEITKHAHAPNDPLVCHACRKLATAPLHATGALRCPRCGADLHRRKPNSLARAWALLIAAAIMYVPANYYPVLEIEILGRSENATILGGVVELFHAGMWEIAALVFFASITVPMLKILGLGYLLISVHFKSCWRLRDRTQLYRLIEGIGRWSMIDMFMVSILVALVQLGGVATIDPGIGATCFASVVVITMFAAAAFDPRFIWDAAEEGE